ncbi:hypothetical protein EW146_g574 [Bondarzewia mesenterica]|uniref:DhaK domain-containing protein n=1 Tax=Bondarzewia mesenterica TaxID=1095465 RepID=A0A4S4M6K4_9AGAM|nr:hypothetical protein EW146_g574 [Bondarzewia mesenterica]
MSNKHIFNSPQGLVLKSLRGAVALNPALRLHAPSKSVYVAHPSLHTRVALVAGGGAGHEPAHASYTGRGMLAASVSGDIFASPSARQILTAIELAIASSSSDKSSLRDVLLIINNYTGDRLNFGLALARARALYADLKIDAVVVADDVSLLRGGALVGPRGLAGNILVCKVLGAYVETGAALEDVKRLADAVVGGALASVGVGLDHCHVPGRSADAEGRAKKGGGKFEGPEGLVAEMLAMILAPRDGMAEGREKEEAFMAIGKMHTEADETVLFVNNLGGMSQLEMGALLDEILNQLDASDIRPRRVYCSAYMTSLNAPGFSLTLLNLSRVYRTLHLTAQDLDILALLDAPTDAHAWLGVRSWPIYSNTQTESEAEAEQLLRTLKPRTEESHGEGRGEETTYWRAADISVGQVQAGIRAACMRVLEVEKDLTAFDTVVGDGDCGETFTAGARAVLRALDNGELEIGKTSPAMLMRRLGGTLEDSMGGTMGARAYFFFHRSPQLSTYTLSVLTFS